MKRKVSKLISMLLATVMVLSMAMTGLAAEETQTLASSADTKGSITIENTAENEVYTIYQIFELTYESDSNGTPITDASYSYQVVDEWTTFITGYTYNGSALFILDVNGYLTNAAEISALGADVIAQFAKDAVSYAEDNEIDGTSARADSTGVVKFTELPLGYYLVDTSLGTLCMLTSTNPDVEIEEKNGVPTPTKTVDHVKDESGSNNDIVEFEVDIDHLTNVSNLVMHDELPEGETLDIDNDHPLTVTIWQHNYDDDGNDSPVEVQTMEEGTDYTVRYGENFTCSKDDPNCSFEVDFTSYDFTGFNENYFIEIVYFADINTESFEYANDDEILINDVFLSYGTYSISSYAEAEVDLFGFEVYKYTGEYVYEVSDEIPLAGAEFELKNEDGTSTAYFLYEDDQGIYLFEGWYSTGAVPEGYTTTLVSDSTGMIKIEGLEAGTYTLTETKAPDGYNKLTYDIMVTITATLDSAEEHLASFTVTYIPSNAAEDTDPTTATDDIIPIQNNAGSALPSTGGMGTTLFYIVGIVLVLGAAVLFVTKKRLDRE